IAAGHDDTSLKRGQMSSDASAYRADSSSGASAYRADSSSDASAYRADQGYRGGQARGGGAVDAAPAPPQRPQRGASLESGYAIKGPNGEPARLRGGKYEHFVSGKWVPYQ
ncbi:hypothetical protein, partial [Phenylobacterium sp.]|uniref:hypothetical protein n=1 Tax=Phenylobacterium sp. TaxID=1871053 RepID=UPI00374D9248